MKGRDITAIITSMSLVDYSMRSATLAATVLATAPLDHVARRLGEVYDQDRHHGHRKTVHIHIFSGHVARITSHKITSQQDRDRLIDRNKASLLHVWGAIPDVVIVGADGSGNPGAS